MTYINNLLKYLFEGSGKIKAISVWLFSFCFSFFNLTGYFFENISCFEEMTTKILFLFSVLLTVLTVLSKIIFTFFYDKFVEIAKNTDFSGKLKNFSFLKIFFLISFFYLVILAAFYPGLCNFDAPVQIPQVQNNTYCTHHPLLHTLILGHIYIVGEKLGNADIGIFIYCLIQLALLAGAFTYLYQYISEKNNNTVIKIISLLFFILYPAHSLLAISTVKDTCFTIMIIFASVLSLRILEGEKRKSIPLLCIMIILMLFFRNNGILALFPVAIILMSAKEMKKFFFVIFCIIVYLVFNSLAANILKAQPIHTDAYFSVTSQQMGRIYTLKNNDNEARDIVKHFYNTDGYLEYRNGGYEYNKYLSDSVSFFIKLEDRELWKYIKSSGKLFIKYPITTIDSYLYLIQGGYYIFDNSTHKIYYYTDVPFGYGNIFETCGITLKSKLPIIKKVYEHLFKYDAYAKYPIFRLILSNALFVWILIFCFIGILSYRKKDYLIVLSFFLFLLISVLLGPCTCTRYYYPIIACSPLFITMLITAIKE